MFRRPDDDDDSDRVVKAKPMSQKFAKKLGIAYGQGKDFVSASTKSQEDFYGQQKVQKDGENDGGGQPLTDADKNKIHAKILKAELKGDQETVKKLKRKLENGITDEQPKEKVVVMMRKDHKGNILPASSSNRHDRRDMPSSSSRMDRELDREDTLGDLVRAERSGTAADQLMLFDRAIVASSKIKRHDGHEESLDDVVQMQKSKKKHDEKDQKRKEDKQRKEHRRLERSLDDCSRCIEGRKLAKHCIVAVGISTYLAVVDWDGLDEQHCLIVPMGHASSSIQLDENVWDEMRIWRKGLVAMWRSEGKDCMFLEMSRNVTKNPHVVIECVPVSDEIGETAPIFFKKSINECEAEYADNKKLIEVKDLRKQIPKGFSYMAVDFGLCNGYAHVIENHEDFPSTFAHEIIAGMLDLPPKKWRKKEKQDFSDLKKKCDAMKSAWEPYDWTKKIQRESSQ